jgi:predicted MPP superfamily phosphohydrolase
MEILRRERVDLVLMTGDMCEHSHALADLTAFTRGCESRRGTFGVLGNWEYWGRVDRRALAAAYAAGGGQLLINQTRFVQIGGKTVAIVGLDDPRSGTPDLRAALRGVPRPDLSIWLVHAPGFVGEVPGDSPAPPALILSGHTHGGQIRLPGLPAYCPIGSGRFVEGWYRDTVGPLYVSRGLGTSVVRARLFCPPELALFTLRRA